MISLIVAMDEQRGIGIDNHLPWHLSDDLKRFRKLTMGHHLIMGRKTYDSIGRPLPGRRMIVLTRNENLVLKDVEISLSLSHAMKLAQSRFDNEIFIAGGGEVFQEALPIANRIYLTQVHAELACDVFFPKFDFSDWVEVSRQFAPADDRNPYASTYKVLDAPISV